MPCQTDTGKMWHALLSMVYGSTFLPDDRVEDVAVSAASRVVKWEPRIGHKIACSQRVADEMVRLCEASGGRQGRRSHGRTPSVEAEQAGRWGWSWCGGGAGAESAMRLFEDLSALVAVLAGAWGAASGKEWQMGRLPEGLMQHMVVVASAYEQQVGALAPAVAACMCVVEAGGTEQGHVEEDSAALPKKRRRRAG